MPTRPRRSRAGHYDHHHQQLTAAAITAEPWCHTLGGCPFPHSATPTNPLTGGHPRTLVEMGGDIDAWKAQPRVAQCRACNSSRRPIAPPT